jgi:hypothetical protein
MALSNRAPVPANTEVVCATSPEAAQTPLPVVPLKQPFQSHARGWKRLAQSPQKELCAQSPQKELCAEGALCASVAGVPANTEVL